jgi:hypothetical protein
MKVVLSSYQDATEMKLAFAYEPVDTQFTAFFTKIWQTTEVLI